MELINSSPFPALAFRQYDQEGHLDCIVAVRGTFEHVQGGSLAMAARQEPFQWEDAYDGDPHAGVLLRQTDLTPDKPGTDVTFIGDSYVPGGDPMRSWLCGLRVGPVQKRLRVHGRRIWRPLIRDRWAGFLAKAPKRVLEGWELGEPEPTEIVSMSWKNAYGGPVPGTGGEADQPLDVEPGNPLGCGIVNLDMGPEASERPAACVTQVDEEKPDWRTGYEPQGFGPISPWWSQRQRHAGSYDDAWLAERHPLLPRDFDARFWQCAPSDLVAIPWLEGGEVYELENLHRSHPLASGQLPLLQLGVTIGRNGQSERQRLNLDGVHFDWRHDDRVLLTWRVRFPLPEAGGVRLTLDHRARAMPGRQAA